MTLNYQQLLARLEALNNGVPLPTIALKFPDHQSFIQTTALLNSRYPFIGAENAASVRQPYLRIGKRGSTGRIIGIRDPNDRNAGDTPYSMYEHYTFTPVTIIHTKAIL